MSGTAIKSSTDAFNTRGKIVSGVGTEWNTITLPFSTLAPRYMPGDCALAWTFCEAPSFNPESALGFQYSLYTVSSTSRAKRPLGRRRDPHHG